MCVLFDEFMTIGIDIRALGSGVRSGIEEYTERLLEHLLPLDSSVMYKLFYASWKDTLPDYPWTHLSNVELKKLRIPSRALFLGAKLFDTPAVDKLVGGADVFFFPHFFLAPLSANCKRVTTFHDMSYAMFPEFFPWRRRLWHRFMNPEWQARMSDRIIAVSDSTKHDVAQRCYVDPAKIDVVHSGVAPAHTWNGERLEHFRADNNLPKRFVLSLGTMEPRKNIGGLMKAFDRLASQSAFADVGLVIVGRKGWLWHDNAAYARQSPHTRRIQFKECTGDERDGYYQLASVLVYPSFLEGFGFPPLEAIAHGTPAIVSANSSLPEVVRDGAILVDPYNVRQLADAVEHILTNENIRVRLAEKGKTLARECSWRKTAEKTLEILTRA